jgi:putative ABC transport system substrate-binding protein
MAHSLSRAGRRGQPGIRPCAPPSAGAHRPKRAERIARLAARGGLPSAGNREHAEAGGLLGYGASEAALYRRGAYFVDRILKGTAPGDLPFERAAEFELVVNMKAARALRLEVLRTVLLSADRVIE